MTADPAAPVLDLGGGIRVHPGILSPELVPVDSIREHERNPRRGDLDALGESVDTNGLYDQVKVQRSTGFILSGNHTYRTLVQRGATQVPVVWLDVDDPEAFRIMTSANSTADRGDYDRRLLVEILVEELGGDTTGSGYYPDDLAVLVRAAEAEDVFGVGADHMLDEFRDLSGQDSTDYQREYARKVAVYLRDDAAVTDFRTRLGVPEDLDLGPRLHYPLDWTPNDRRLTWKQERDGD